MRFCPKCYRSLPANEWTAYRCCEDCFVAAHYHHIGLPSGVMARYGLAPLSGSPEQGAKRVQIAFEAFQ